MTTVGVIGTGSMGGMLIRKMVESGWADAGEIAACNRSAEKARLIADETGIRIEKSARDVAEQAEIVLLCVRPLEVHDVLSDLQDVLTPEKLLVSVASDVTLEDLAAWSDARTVRVIPTIASTCGGGVTLAAFGATATAEDRRLVRSLFDAMSETVEIGEAQIEVMTALTSCAPGFIAALMQEFAAAAVRRTGITPTVAERMVKETLVGTTRLLAGSGSDLAGLVDAVATEGGITGEGVAVFRQRMPAVFDELLERTHAKHETVKRQIHADTRFR